MLPEVEKITPPKNDIKPSPPLSMSVDVTYPMIKNAWDTAESFW